MVQLFLLDEPGRPSSQLVDRQSLTFRNALKEVSRYALFLGVRNGTPGLAAHTEVPDHGSENRARMSGLAGVTGTFAAHDRA